MKVIKDNLGNIKLIFNKNEFSHIEIYSKIFYELYDPLKNYDQFIQLIDEIHLRFNMTYANLTNYTSYNTQTEIDPIEMMVYYNKIKSPDLNIDMLL